MTLSSLLKTHVKRQLAKTGYSLNRMDDLTYLADLHGSDKGTRYSAHMYTRIYTKFFEKIREDEIVILEIGLLRPDLDKRRVVNAMEGGAFSRVSRAPSLEMW